MNRPTVLPRSRAVLQITETVALGDDEIGWTFSRSGGPGGQNVNKVASKAQLSWALEASPALTEAAKARLRKAHPSCVTLDGSFQITSQESRDQARNREICLEKLAEYIRAALVPPKARFATKPTRSSKKRRVADKRLNSERKASRRPGKMDD
jgi:ribosome-associated protein